MISFLPVFGKSALLSVPDSDGDVVPGVEMSDSYEDIVFNIKPQPVSYTHLDVYKRQSLDFCTKS